PPQAPPCSPSPACKPGSGWPRRPPAPSGLASRLVAAPAPRVLVTPRLPQVRFRRHRWHRGAGPSAAPRRRGRLDKPCLAVAPHSSSWLRLLLASEFGPSATHARASVTYYGLC